MRFTCEKSMLVTGLNITGRAVAQKSALSALEGILCRAGCQGYILSDHISNMGYGFRDSCTGVPYPEQFRHPGRKPAHKVRDTERSSERHSVHGGYGPEVYEVLLQDCVEQQYQMH